MRLTITLPILFIFAMICSAETDATEPAGKLWFSAEYINIVTSVEYRLQIGGWSDAAVAVVSDSRLATVDVTTDGLVIISTKDNFPGGADNRKLTVYFHSDTELKYEGKVYLPGNTELNVPGASYSPLLGVLPPTCSRVERCQADSDVNKCASRRFQCFNCGTFCEIGGISVCCIDNPLPLIPPSDE